MAASEPGRAMTPFDGFRHNSDVPAIPGPPPLPTDISPPLPAESTKPPPSPLEEMREQLASVHSALHSPDGLLHSLFANLLQVQARQHEEAMRTLTTLANGIADLSNRMAHIEPEVERQGARLSLAAVDGESVAATGAE